MAVDFDADLLVWIIRFMFPDLMILILGHSSGALRIHLRYTGHVPTKSAIYTYTGPDTMGGYLTQ